jgi:hypothetical protein
MNANATPATLVPETIGAPYEGGHYGGQIRIGAGLYAIAWAPKAQGETKAVWLNSYTSVPGATSCFDSAANTAAMAAAGSPLGKWAQALTINGHSDWCVPARDVLELAYQHLKPSTEANSATFRDGDNPSSVPAGYPYTRQSPVQTAVSAFQKGQPEAFAEDWYWASTQYSGNRAWLQDFNYGSQSTNSKKAEGRCRAVRRFDL